MKTDAMFEGNLALDIEQDFKPTFTVVDGGLGASSNSSQHKSSSATYIAIALLAISLIGIMVSFCIVHSENVAQAIGTAHHTMISVREGDSLWSIASECNVPGLTTQEISDAIVSFNHLDSKTLTPGQELTVPSR